MLEQFTHKIGSKEGTDPAAHLNTLHSLPPQIYFVWENEVKGEVES
jgi:hypothetical protein